VEAVLSLLEALESDGQWLRMTFHNKFNSSRYSAGISRRIISLSVIFKVYGAQFGLRINSRSLG